MLPIRCSCGALVGVAQATRRFTARVCPGMHQEPTITRKKRLGGLVQTVQKTYETGTVSVWDEYLGPKFNVLVWLAIMTSKAATRGVLINNKWCWWSIRTGLYGDGATEFVNSA